MRFGEYVRKARIDRRLTLKQVADKILKEDGSEISPQYLNDLEHDRRSPATTLIKQFAQQLDLEYDYLTVLVAQDRYAQLAPGNSSPEQVKRALVAYRKALKQR